MTNNPRRLAARAPTSKGRWPRALVELAVLAVVLAVATGMTDLSERRSVQAESEIRSILAPDPADGDAAPAPFWSSWGLQAILLAAVLAAYLIAVESALWLQKKPLRIIIRPRPPGHRNGTMRLVFFSFAISAIFFVNGQPWVGGVFLVFAAAYLIWRSREGRRVHAPPRAMSRDEAAPSKAGRSAPRPLTGGARPRRADLTPPRDDRRRRARASSCRRARS